MKKLANSLGKAASVSKLRLANKTNKDSNRTSERTLMMMVAAALAAVFAGLYLFKVSTLVPTGGGEIHIMQAANSANDILRNPLLLPFKVAGFVFMHLPISDLLAVRLASVTIALLSSILFFTVAQRWYGRINGSIATILFMTSGWLLHTGRYGAGFGVFTLIVLALLNLFVWMSHAQESGRAVILFTIAATLALFVPGGLWLVLAGVLVCRQTITSHLKAVPARTIIVASLIAAVGLALLAVTILREPGLLRQWIGLPDDTPVFIQLAKQAITSISAFTVRGPFVPEVWLAHTPLLDAASSILLLIGVIFYSRHTRNTRTLLLLAFFAVGVVLVTFNGSVALGFLAPIIYLVISGGLAYFLHQWRKVFPKNPVARSVGYIIVGFLVLSISIFHTQRYFVAWRYSPDTIQAYEDAKHGANPTPYLIQ